MVLARATLPIGAISRFGIWAAVRFRAISDDPGAAHDSAKLLSELIADLIALIDSRQADEFAAQLSEVIEFHSFLYRLAQLSDEDFNYAQLDTKGKRSQSASLPSHLTSESGGLTPAGSALSLALALHSH